MPRLSHPPIWFVRHGETDWNRAGRIQGQCDESRLTARGKAQARALAVALAHHLPQARNVALLASPSTRVRQTLACILPALGRTMNEVTFDARLLERAFGVWEGRSAARMRRLYALRGEEGARHYFHWRPPGGESLGDVCRRLEPLLAAMPGPALIVAHGGIMRAFAYLLLGASEAQAARMAVPQGALCLLRDNTARWQNAFQIIRASPKDE